MRSILTAVALASSLAAAEPQQCLGRGKAQWQVDETLVVQVNPVGPENQARANLCLPLFDRPGILFDYTQFDVGFFSYVSPVYAHLGPYVAITPLSFVQFRLDVSGLVQWPLPLDGAGYYALPGYTRDYQDTSLPAAAARGAAGLNVTFSTTLQGAVPLTDRLELEATTTGAADYWNVGTGPAYVNLRRDMVMKQSDLLLKNTGFVFLDLKATETFSVQLGVSDDLTYVPGSGALLNIVSGVIKVLLRRDRDLRDIEAFVRLGAYTQHPFREGFTLLGGLSMGWAFPNERAGRAEQ